MARPPSDEVDILFPAWLEELGLCSQYKLAAGLYLVPESYRAALYYKRLIKRMGLKRALKRVAKVLLYTGPRTQVKAAIHKTKGTLFTDKRKNHDKAIYFARNYGYELLELTPLEKIIDEYPRTASNGKTERVFLYRAFLKELTKYAKTNKGLEAFAQTQFDLVMGLVSAAFIFTCEGNVDTLVSGASPTKVFYLFELPALMANDKITSINNVPKTEFLKIYNSDKQDAAYQTHRKICETEIDRLGILARRKGKRSPEWRIWQEQKEQFYADGKQQDLIRVCKNILIQKAAAAAPALKKATVAAPLLVFI